MSDGFTLSGGSSAEQLKALFLRLKALDDESIAINADKRSVLAEAKKADFDGPTLTLAVRRSRKDPAELLEADGLLETYEAITGTGAAAGGTLSMKRNEAGVFEAKIVEGGGEEAEAKLTRSAKSRRRARTDAALAARAREEF